MHTRLLDVAYPLLIAAAEGCPFDQELTYGFLLQNEAGAAQAVQNPTQGRAVVAYVHSHLPAAQAGLSVGDIILQVNTVDVAGESADNVGGMIGRMTRAKVQPLQCEILQAGRHRTVTMSAIPACHYSMQVLNSAMINGVTDGRRIGVTSGALQFFLSDDELGWVVAHEIAHNILSHVQNAKLQAMLRTFLAARGEVPGSMATMSPRPSLESQADYVGAYLMARAGYDLSAIKRVWERLARLEVRQNGQAQGLNQTHPPTTERLTALEVTIQEIQAKRRLGQPLEISVEKH
jgi:predicted Zn-dependent protease